MDPRCSEGIFVGYDKYSPSYLLYYPNKHVVRRHRIVKFTEQFSDISKPNVIDDGTDGFLPDNAAEPILE